MSDKPRPEDFDEPVTRTWKHGTHYGYYHKKCPCGLCKTWWKSQRSPKRRAQPTVSEEVAHLQAENRQLKRTVEGCLDAVVDLFRDRRRLREAVAEYDAKKQKGAA